MLDAARRLAPVCLLATLACRPEPAPSEAPAAVTDPSADPSADRGGPTTDAPREAAAPELEPDREDQAPELAVTKPDSESDPNANSEEPASDPQPSAAKPATESREPLPKPIHRVAQTKCQQSFAVGEKVKNFRLPSVAGDKTISPAGYRKRVVLLNFWGTWCKPCLAELPEFDRLYRKYRRHGMTLVAVATDEDAKAVQAFIDEHKLIAKVALDGEQAAGDYGRPNFPFSFVIDGEGTIVAAYDYVDDKCLGDLEQVIRTSLEQL